MTDHGCFIVDAPLPEALNFELLKNNGIKQLQTSVGEVWTNYNESDPGVTILDQLCYALTELGYCAQFPIEDVLTQENGKIHFLDQFFEPQNILTCSPVTPDDYRKLVHDNVPEVRVIYIEAESAPASVSSVDQTVCTGRYLSHLSIKDSVPPAIIKQVIDRVHVLLNKHRNLAELFLPPVILAPKRIELAGKVWLTQSADAAKVQSQISQAFISYAAPLVVQSGYKELLSKGFEPDQIFNGPKLRHGWIAGSDALGSKCQSVSLAGLTTLIASIDGVLNVESLSFRHSASKLEDHEISIGKNEIPNITLSGQFQLVRNGLSVTTQPGHSDQKYFGVLRANHQAASVAAKVDLYPDLPQGKYRNIEEYYSVQNTFPDIYGIGHNSLESNATSYRVANSRQLKGYLMVFDQLLANQFSQLAHIGNLFSFQSNHAKSAQALSVASAITHKKFITTYHCQPLYDIPNVKPLLRGNEAFHYQFDPSLSDKQVEDKAWKEYKKFQFNEYIYGLRQSMESESEAMTRRDAMLSHLMARHGDDATLYHDMIETCQWFGSQLKTHIIVKSIWLQNYQMLSYHRTRACDIYAVNTLLPLPGAPSIIRAVKRKFRKRGAVNSNQANGKDKDLIWWVEPSFPTIDGEVDQTRIYSEAKLRKFDFDNLSTFELKAGILLGLSARFQSLAGKLFALLAESSFNKWLSQAVKDEKPYYLTDSDVSIVRANGKDQLFEGKQCLLDIVWSSKSTLPTRTDYQNHADQLLWLATQRRGFLLIEPVLFLSTQNLNAENAQEQCFLSIYLLFPAYVTLIQQPKFQNFIETLVKLHWPAHVEISYLPKSFVVMKAIITHFVKWNNKQKNTSIRDIFSKKLARLLKLSQISSQGQT